MLPDVPGKICDPQANVKATVNDVAYGYGHLPAICGGWAGPSLIEL